MELLGKQGESWREVGQVLGKGSGGGDTEWAEFQVDSCKSTRDAFGHQTDEQIEMV